MDVKHILTNRKVQIGIASSLVVGGVAGFYFLRKRRKKVETKVYYIQPHDDPQHRLFDDEGNSLVLEEGDRILIDPEPREAPFRSSLKYKEAMEELAKRANDEKNLEIVTGKYKDDPFGKSSGDSENSEEIEAEVAPEAPFNVFSTEEPTDVWDYDDELSRRKPDEPYILHVSEFIENESGFHQSTVTYYAGDDIMANEEDTPIYDFKKLFGELQFGHGSGDLGTVYIRNESFKSEWEVIYHPGKFSVIVMGEQYEHEAEVELKHSVQKFRPE